MTGALLGGTPHIVPLTILAVLFSILPGGAAIIAVPVGLVTAPPAARAPDAANDAMNITKKRSIRRKELSLRKLSGTAMYFC